MRILLLAVVAVLGALLFLQAPEIRRYLNMRSM
jgi:hypothetical protein